MKMNFCPRCGRQLEVRLFGERERPQCLVGEGGCGFVDFGHYSLGVGGVVVTTGEDGISRALLIQRGEEPNRGGWTIPGGFVEFDEIADVAVVREVKEETGLECQVVGLMGFRNRADPHDNNSYAVFLLEVIGGVLVADPTDEIAQAGFFSLEEMRTMPRLAPLSFELAAAGIEKRVRLFKPVTVQGVNGRPPFTLFM
ncbi:MAG TPA: NUDIX hydrolase [Chloroflexia bacterium]|nr:NUDIX hydrolase [Chloroflexia bacterium]